MSGLSDTFSRPFDLKALLKISDLSSPVRKHLSKVYADLTLCLLSAAIGSLAYIAYGVGGWGTSILGLICMIAFLSAEKASQTVKYSLFLGFGFLQGLSVGPLCARALHVDPSILITALVATTCIFICFSLAALYAEKRSYLYLGGGLASWTLVLSLMGLLNIFLRFEFLFNLQLAIGLLIFIGYVVYDTQMIILKAETGDRNHLRHAFELFVDFVAIFVRILIILLKNAEKKKSRD